MSDISPTPERKKPKLEDDILGVTSPDDLSDITLLVEEKKLYGSRAVLMSASPVWKAMLRSNFKEKDAEEIPLPDKSYDDVKEMLCCIAPSILKKVSRERVEGVLALAEEYQILGLKKLCESCLLVVQAEKKDTALIKEKNKEGYLIIQPSADLTHQMHLLVVAATYGLIQLLRECVHGIASRHTYRAISECPDFRKLDGHTIPLTWLLKERLRYVDNKYQ